MNENLNLVEILKDCPEGFGLYSSVHGEVKFVKCLGLHLVIVKKGGEYYYFTQKGVFTFQGISCKGECTLFPSKEQRSWSKFTAPWHKKEKFDPTTLKPFDKVLVRDNRLRYWVVQLFSHIIEGELNYPYLCVNNSYKYCIPYNDETKHLVGKTEEAPEFYRY